MLNKKVSKINKRNIKLKSFNKLNIGYFPAILLTTN